MSHFGEMRTSICRDDPIAYQRIMYGPYKFRLYTFDLYSYHLYSYGPYMTYTVMADYLITHTLSLSDVFWTCVWTCVHVYGQVYENLYGHVYITTGYAAPGGDIRLLRNNNR